jgi:hypothetical protein
MEEICIAGKAYNLAEGEKKDSRMLMISMHGKRGAR